MKWESLFQAWELLAQPDPHAVLQAWGRPLVFKAECRGREDGSSSTQLFELEFVHHSIGTTYGLGMSVFLDVGREIVRAGLCWLGSLGSGSGLAVEKEESLTKHS